MKKTTDKSQNAIKKSSSSNKKQSESLNTNEAANNNEPQQDDEFPGYPHYSADEDIMKSDNAEKVDVDVEDFTRTTNISKKETISTTDEIMEAPLIPEVIEKDEDLEIVPGTEADVTDDDLILLGEKEQDLDLGDDETLHQRIYPIDMAAADLDIPGAELDDENEEIGEEDEENNFYSLGDTE